MVGDICESDPLVTDEEIAWALEKFSDPQLASALVLRALAARASRAVTSSVGDVSRSCSDMAKAFSARALELDPLGVTVPAALVLPVFGGLSKSGKDAYDSDDDAVQVHWKIGQDDIPGGPDDTDPSERWEGP